MLRDQLLHHLLLFLRRQRTYLAELGGHIFAQTIQHALEKLEAFVLVFIERITLGIAAEANHRAQMLKRQQVLTPFAVDRL